MEIEKTVVQGTKLYETVYFRHPASCGRTVCDTDNRDNKRNFLPSLKKKLGKRVTKKKTKPKATIFYKKNPVRRQTNFTLNYRCFGLIYLRSDVCYKDHDVKIKIHKFKEILAKYNIKIKSNKYNKIFYTAMAMAKPVTITWTNKFNT
jgi:hypothetical protein